MTTAKLVTVARAPRPPRSLGPEAREFWKATARPLVELGIMDPRLDVTALELTATAYEIWRKAIREAAEAPPERQKLLREIAGEWADELIKWLAVFGLTPAARDELRQALEDPKTQAQGEFLRLLREARRADQMGEAEG